MLAALRFHHRLHRHHHIGAELLRDQVEHALHIGLLRQVLAHRLHHERIGAVAHQHRCDLPAHQHRHQHEQHADGD
jgi:hypothetical protein